MIYNIKPETFGGILRAGDLVAVGNVVEFLRNANNNQNIKFKLDLSGVSNEYHCLKMLEFLKKYTNYFTDETPNEDLEWERVNLWDFRAISGDLVKISNPYPTENKVVVFPLFDAPYNTYRNWPMHTFIDLLKQIEESYPELDKTICISENIKLNQIDYDFSNWKIETDYEKNIYHIMTASVFYGGETGVTSYASALMNGPECNYVYSNRALSCTHPFNFLEKGRMKYYWLDFEGTIIK